MTPPALGEDWPAIAARAAHYGITDPGQALAAWRASTEEVRAAWRASADAVRMLLDARPAPELAAAERDRDEARAVVREMCAHWERVGTTREEDELMPQWRQRAGIED